MNMFNISLITACTACNEITWCVRNNGPVLKGELSVISLLSTTYSEDKLDTFCESLLTGTRPLVETADCMKVATGNSERPGARSFQAETTVERLTAAFCDLDCLMSTKRCIDGLRGESGVA